MRHWTEDVTCTVSCQPRWDPVSGSLYRFHCTDEGAGAQGEVKWLAQGHKASENSWATISSSVLNTNDLVSQLSFWSMVHFILQLEGRRSGRLGALLKDAQLGSFRAASDCGFGTPSPGLSLPWLAAHSAQLETSLWNLSKQMRATQCPLPPSYSDETK